MCFQTFPIALPAAREHSCFGTQDRCQHPSVTRKLLFTHGSKSLARSASKYFFTELRRSPLSSISDQSREFSMSRLLALFHSRVPSDFHYSRSPARIPEFLSSIFRSLLSQRISRQVSRYQTLGVVLPRSKLTPNGPRSLNHRPKRWLK